MQLLLKINPRNLITIDNRIVYVDTSGRLPVLPTTTTTYCQETRNTKDKRKTASCNILYCPIFP